MVKYTQNIPINFRVSDTIKCTQNIDDFNMSGMVKYTVKCALSSFKIVSQY